MIQIDAKNQTQQWRKNILSQTDTEQGILFDTA